MISILSMAINTAISFLLYILKAVFSMLLWFIKAFVKVLKLFFSVLPITAIFFILFLVFTLIIVVCGNTAPFPYHIEIGGTSFFIASKDSASPLFSALKDWWAGSISTTKGTLSYVILLALTVLMFVPVTTVFLCISTLASYGTLLFYACLLDVAVYLIRMLFGKNIVAQMLDRYYFLFPDAGKRHNEKSYEKWLRKHHREFEEDNYENPSIRKKKKVSAFYEDDYGNDEFYEEDDEEEFYENDDEEDLYENHRRYHGRNSDNEYNSNHNRYATDDEEYDPDYDEDYEDDEDEEDFEDYEDDDEDFEDDYDDPAPRTSFDFFAGCTDMDSVEKKYRSLAKLYHPDNMDGDTASFQEINAQYAAAKKGYRSK